MGIHTDEGICRECGGVATTVTNTREGWYQLLCHDENCCFMFKTTPSGTTVISKEEWKDIAEEFGFFSEEVA